MRTGKIKFYLGSILVLCLLLSGFSQDGKQPKVVNWSYDGAYKEDNGARSKIILNGWWRWKLSDKTEEEAEPPKDGWFYRKVPAYGHLFDILDGNGKPIEIGIKKDQFSKDDAVAKCWVEREFTVPESWKGKDVRLVFGNIMKDGGEIYLDGKEMGITWKNITHSLSIPKPYHFDKPYTLAIKSEGVIGNIWLTALNPGPRITDNYLTTATDDMKATIRASGTGKVDGKIKVVIVDYKDPSKVIKTAGPFSVKTEEKGWKIQDSFVWKDAKLWSLEHPNLYKYYLELIGSDGKIQDKTFPIRFGFRQVGIKNGRFTLNGKPITITNDIHSGLGTRLRYNNQGKWSNDETIRKIIRRWKNLGVNCAEHRWGINAYDDNLFRVADEEGFFISIHSYSVKGSPAYNKIPEYRKHLEEQNKYLIQPKRHSPSVVYYHMPATHQYAPCWDYQPSKLGEDYEMEKDYLKDLRELLRKLDPARFSFAHSGGGKYQPVHSSMNYISPDADLQVHENWPSHWAKNKNKPLVTYEMEAPTYISNWCRRRSRGEQMGKFPYFLEVGAIHLGEEPYLKEPKENIEKSLLRAEKNKFYPVKATWTHQETGKMFVKNVFRSWRTYGVNMGFFCMVRDYFKAPYMTMPSSTDDPRKPGAQPDKNLRFFHVTIGKMTPMGKVAKRNLSPLLAYIGGPDGNFSLKDRAYFSGSTIKKAVVVVNNTETPVKLSGFWELQTPKGKKVFGGKLPETEFKAGELAPESIHIEFKTPKVTKRSDFVLKLSGQADRAGVLDDTFALTVFPKTKKPSIPKGLGIYLYDPVGDTKKILDKAGVSCKLIEGELPTGENNLLIIGRNALKDKKNARRFKGLVSEAMSYDFATTLPNGLRVLVFEQALGNIWGLKTEESRWRRSFIRAPGHPVFKGLEDVDFKYLKGNSDLAEAYPIAPYQPKRSSIKRFPEWGNDNVVTTYSIIKPQLGSCRALLDCGFALLETPLLEYAAGKGRMIFCQVDVTPRYGKDPVSTQLVNNIISYIASAKEPDPAIGKPIDIVREGDEEYDIKIKKEKVFMVERPEGEISWGVSMPNLYFQEIIKIPVIIGKDGKKYVYSKIKGEKKFVHTLNRRSFKTKWQKMNAMIIRAALWINQGSSGETFPEPSLQGDEEELYPLEWVEGFVHPYLMMQW